MHRGSVCASYPVVPGSNLTAGIQGPCWSHHNVMTKGLLLNMLASKMRTSAETFELLPVEK